MVEVHKIQQLHQLGAAQMHIVDVLQKIKNHLLKFFSERSCVAAFTTTEQTSIAAMGQPEGSCAVVLLRGLRHDLPLWMGKQTPMPP
jgi:hypothetical protein